MPEAVCTATMSLAGKMMAFIRWYGKANRGIDMEFVCPDATQDSEDDSLGLSSNAIVAKAKPPFGIVAEGRMLHHNGPFTPFRGVPEGIFRGLSPSVIDSMLTS